MPRAERSRAYEDDDDDVGDVRSYTVTPPTELDVKWLSTQEVISLEVDDVAPNPGPPPLPPVMK